MKINNLSWHCRVYLWWYEHKYGFPNERGYSNLCPYMRAVLFWAPLRAVFGTWIKIHKIPTNAITIPLSLIAAPLLAGYLSYPLKTGLLTLYLIVGCVGACLGFIGLSLWLFAKDGKNLAAPLKSKIKQSNFLELVRAYFRSAHDRVCPEISWKTEAK